MTPTLPPDERPTHIRWWIAGLACATSWLLYLHRYAWGVVKPSVKKEFPELTDVDWGWCDSAFMAAYAVGQVPSGAIGDIYGPRRVLSVLVLLWSAACAAIAWVPGSKLLFAAVLGTLGIAQAGAYPVLSKVTSRWFPFSVRTRFQGLIAAFGRLGGASAPFLIATVCLGWLALPWRTALTLIALPGVLIALAIAVVFRSQPRDHPSCNEAERQLVEAGAPTPVPGTKPAIVLNLGTTFSLGLMLIYTFLSTFADQLFVFWIPSFLKDGKGLSNQQMGIFATLPLIGGAVGGIVAGVLNDTMIKRVGPRVGRSSVAFAGKTLAGVLIAASVFIEDGRLVMVALFFCRFFNDWSLTTLWGTITDISGRAAGTIFGIINTFGTFGGFVAGPIMGWVKFKYDWSGLFYTVAGVYVAAGLCWIFIDCTRKIVVESDAATGA